jgi:LPS export ABC transporter protein LptC
VARGWTGLAVCARALAAGLLAALLAACGGAGSKPSAAQSGGGPTPPAATAGAPVYRISAQGTGARPVRISNILHGKTEYTVAAASVVYSTDLRRGTFFDTTLHFFKGGRTRLTVTAPRAIVNELSHDVALTGGVTARTAFGETLAADSMLYHEHSRLLTATGHVVLRDPKGDTLTGTRAVADLDLQQVRLYGSLRP